MIPVIPNIGKTSKEIEEQVEKLTFVYQGRAEEAKDIEQQLTSQVKAFGGTITLEQLDSFFKKRKFYRQVAGTFRDIYIEK